MKKIVLFINSIAIGGAERQLCELANGLSERHYDVTIVTYGDVSDLYRYNSKVKRKKIAPGKSKYYKLLYIWYYFLTIHTDWVISFCQRQNFFCLIPLLFRSNKAIRVIAGERNTTKGKPSMHEKLLINWLYKRVDYIVPNSYTQKTYIINKKPQYEIKTVAITNYTDLTLYNKTPLPNNELLRIGVFCRYSEQKNCMRFVDMIYNLKKQTSQKFVVEWYGDKYIKDTQLNYMYEKMQNRIIEKELENYIILKDQIEDVATELKRFDIICLPSLFEGFSNSIAEAICCGKPMLVSDVSDNKIMVHEGENGFLFDPTSEEDMAKAFLKMFSTIPEERQQMGDNSRILAEKLFDREKYINSYIKLIES